MIEDTTGDLRKNRYIKIQYEVTAEHHEELPGSVFEKSNQRALIVRRDETCDEQLQSFIYKNEGISLESAKKYPSLVLLPGSEKIHLPEEGGVLPCYVFNWEGIVR